MKRKNNKKNIRETIKIVMALIIFFISIIGIFIYKIQLNTSNHQPKISSEIIDDDKLKELAELYQLNNDLVGWIKIDDTNINYPVVYKKGEDYYLERDFYQKKNKAGTLFIDKYNTVVPRDTNLIIYGHNMKNKTMFHDLLNYKKEDFYQKHKIITYYTLEEKQEYEIVAVFLSKVYNVNDKSFKYYKFYNAKNENEYNTYIKNIKRLSLYDTKVIPKYNNELLTLSTCEYSQENGRLVVVASKMQS